MEESQNKHLLSLLEVFMTVLLIIGYICTVRMYFIAKQPSKIDNYTLILQESETTLSKCQLDPVFVSIDPKIDGIISNDKQQIIIIDITSENNWEYEVANRINEIIKYIIKNRNNTLYEVKGRDLVFLVKKSWDTNTPLFLLPYDTIMGYKPNDLSIDNKVFTTSLQYYHLLGKEALDIERNKKK